MLLLVSTSDKIQVITGQAITTDVHASYVDFDGSASVTPGRKNTAITTATTTDVVAAPGSGVYRNVKTLLIRNKHATSSVDVTVQHTDGTTTAELHKVTLAPQQALEYVEDVGFFVVGTTPISLLNYSTAAQTPTAATLTQLTGSDIRVPVTKLRIGTMFRWTFDITKTGAGTAASSYFVRIGTTNTTSDAAILTFTKPAGTGVIDTGLITIHAVIRGPLSASCIMAGTFQMTHNLSATGHAVIPVVVQNVVSSAFDATVAGLFVSLRCTTGASDAITTQSMLAQAIGL